MRLRGGQSPTIRCLRRAARSIRRPLAWATITIARPPLMSATASFDAPRRAWHQLDRLGNSQHGLRQPTQLFTSRDQLLASVRLFFPVDVV